MRTIKCLLRGVAAALLSMLAFTALAGCISQNPDKSRSLIPQEKIEGSSLYVKKVENLPKDFILGMDISSVLSLEKSGVKYYDFDGKERDLFEILASNGVTHIRVRIWNDPFDSSGNGYGGGNCDIEAACEIGRRAASVGMKLIADFHYSDFWADPGKQMVPKAWKGMEIEDKCAALYDYTVSCLEKLKSAGAQVALVQVGNETNGALCGEKTWMNVCKLMSSGAKAVRKALPEAQVAVHFANPERGGAYIDYAWRLDYYGVDYDVFASSYYPFWHGTLENLTSVLAEVADTYGKKVMVMETSYAFTDADTDFSGNTISSGGAIVKDYPFTVQGQANNLRNVVEATVKTGSGVGVVYWEGAWITVGTSSWEENSALWERYGSGWASSFAAEYDPDDAGKYYGGSAVDNQAFFDAQGKALESLRVFNLLRYGNETEIVADAVEDTNIICDLNGKLVLPEKVNAVMTDDSRRAVDVTWNITNEEIEKMYKGGVKKYTVTGTADGREALCYISMIEYNFLENYSFESGELAPWRVTDHKKADELFVENKSTDSLTGNYHMHFWSAASDSVEFTLEQDVENLPEGSYKFSVSIMGGDGGETDIFAFVRIDGETVATAKTEMTVYNEWHTAKIDSFSVKEGQKLTVGIYVKCAGEGNGAWGKIDDALLNSVAG